MPTVAAPIIVQEMNEWLRLGGGNSGIVGDPNHDSGFHIGARYLPSTDYSRRRDPNGPNGPYVNWDYSCAGDFSHRNREDLRAYHRRLLADLMAGKKLMICEFIGKPWSDRPVYYWARWNGINTLQRYTGKGHDHWSHISWYRSKVDKKADLWEVDMDLTQKNLNDIGDIVVSKIFNHAFGSPAQGVENRRFYEWMKNAGRAADAYQDTQKLLVVTQEISKKSTPIVNLTQEQLTQIISAVQASIKSTINKARIVVE